LENASLVIFQLEHTNISVSSHFTLFFAFIYYRPIIIITTAALSEFSCPVYSLGEKRSFVSKSRVLTTNCDIS